MNVDELSTGNLIKVFPREDQEGLLSVKEIFEGSIVCEMIRPRKGYLFRIKISEMNPVPLSSDMLHLAGYSQDNDKPEHWTDIRGKNRFVFSGSSGKFVADETRQVHFMHEFQNLYYRITGNALYINE